MMRTIICKDFSNANVPDCPPCCESCHEDADKYGYDLLGDGENYSICCKLANWLESHGIDLYSPVTLEIYETICGKCNDPETRLLQELPNK